MSACSKLDIENLEIQGLKQVVAPSKVSTFTQIHVMYTLCVSMHIPLIGPETCATQPDKCQVDRISVMNEEGKCQYHCAAGYSGDLCNSKY